MSYTGRTGGASNGSTTEIEGLADLNALLQELPERIERNVMRGAVRAGSTVMEEKVRQFVPKRSGKLAASIRTSVRVRNGKISATIKAGNREAWYAHLVEFGTTRHLIKPSKRKSLFFAGIMREVIDHPGAKEQPFMRRALDEGQQAAVEAVRDYVRDRLPKEFKKQARLRG